MFSSKDDELEERLLGKDDKESHGGHDHHGDHEGEDHEHHHKKENGKERFWKTFTLLAGLYFAEILRLV